MDEIHIQNHGLVRAHRLRAETTAWAVRRANGSGFMIVPRAELAEFMDVQARYLHEPDRYYMDCLPECLALEVQAADAASTALARARAATGAPVSDSQLAYDMDASLRRTLRAWAQRDFAQSDGLLSHKPDGAHAAQRAAHPADSLIAFEIPAEHSALRPDNWKTT